MSSTLSACDWGGRVMGTRARLEVVTGDPAAGDEALRSAVEDLNKTERTLSRFMADSALSRLNRLGAGLPDARLLAAIEKAIDAYEWSGGLLDPRIIDSLERYGYREGVPGDDVGEVEPPGALPPVDMRAWLGESGRVSLPPGVRLDLAGVGKALGIGWAAMRLAGHEGLLVDVGGDVVAIGSDENGEPWTVLVMHEEPVGQFSGGALAVATSTTRRRAWTAGGDEAHHLIDPRTGAPSTGDLSYATVAAPTILEADLAAKLLILEGPSALERFDASYRTITTDRNGNTEVFA